jgi:FKBP-type peptidyl-prolyl cis-trans isomerase
MRVQKTLVCLAAVLTVAACGKTSEKGNDANRDSDQPAATTQPAVSAANAQAVEIEPGLTMKILRVGTGATAEPGQIAIVHYTGWLYDDAAEGKRGKKFDSSLDRDQHFQFPLGAGRVIKGWDQGVVGMREGEIRELTIAPELAYGDKNVGNGLIPPGSTLIFEVELARAHSVKPEIELPAAPQ